MAIKDFGRVLGENGRSASVTVKADDKGQYILTMTWYDDNGTAHSTDTPNLIGSHVSMEVVTNTDDAYIVKFTWVDADGTPQEVVSPNLLGVDGTSPSITVIEDSDTRYVLGFTYVDSAGTVHTEETPNLKGQDGTIGENGAGVEVSVNTQTASQYILDITQIAPDGTVSTFHTPNLRGKDGISGGESGNGIDVVVKEDSEDSYILEFIKNIKTFTWTETPGAVAAATCLSLTWNGSIFCGVGSNQYFTSSDGTNWTAGALPVSNGKGITHNGTIFCVVGTNSCATSIDGTNWTAQVIPAGDYMDIEWNGTIFCAVGNNCCATSPDGINWTAQTIPAGNYMSIAWSGLLFCAVGSYTTTITSKDGVQWQQVNALAEYRKVLWGNGNFVAIGDSSTVYGTTDKVAVSTDGISWDVHNNAIPVGTAYAAAFGHGIFCIAGTGAGVNPPYCLTSADGIEWGDSGYTPSNSIGCLAWNGTMFCGVALNAGFSTTGIAGTTTDSITTTPDLRQNPATNTEAGLMQGTEENTDDPVATFGKISIETPAGNARVNNVFLQNSADYDAASTHADGVYFLLSDALPEDTSGEVSDLEMKFQDHRATDYVLWQDVWNTQYQNLLSDAQLNGMTVDPLQQQNITAYSSSTNQFTVTSPLGGILSITVINTDTTFGIVYINSVDVGNTKGIISTKAQVKHLTLAAGDTVYVTNAQQVLFTPFIEDTSSRLWQKIKSLETFEAETRSMVLDLQADSQALVRDDGATQDIKSLTEAGPWTVPANSGRGGVIDYKAVDFIIGSSGWIKIDGTVVYDYGGLLGLKLGLPTGTKKVMDGQTIETGGLNSITYTPYKVKPSEGE